MAKGSNIVHQYYRKEFEGFVVLVKVNPILLKGTEITLRENSDPEIRDLDFDEHIFDDLKADGFVESSPLEFNLHYHGLA